MDRIPDSLTGKIMTATEAAKYIKTGMTVGMSGFTVVGYPKAIPSALVESGHAKDLTICIGASVGDEIDGAMVRAGLVKRRFAYQSNKDMRTAINSGVIEYSDMHVSQFPRYINMGVGPRIDVAVVECSAITEQGLVPPAQVGCTDALIRTADKVIVEVNMAIPDKFLGIHDVFDIGVPPMAKPIPVLKSSDRIGVPYIECPPEKIVGIVLTDKLDQAPKFKPIDEVSKRIGENVEKFLKNEVAEGRLPANIGPIQSGVGSVGNAVLSALADSGFEGLEMYTEVMQDSALELLEKGIFKCASSAALSLSEKRRASFYEELDSIKDRIVLRPQEISNHPEVIRRLGVIALNTPIEVDIYGNVNSTHIMGSSIMNGLGGSADFSRNARISIFATNSLAKDGKISCIVPMVSHVDHTEHDVQVIITEQGIADLRWKTPKERAELLIENCAHPDYRPLLRDYYQRATQRGGQHTPHILDEALSWHERYLRTGTMMP